MTMHKSQRFALSAGCAVTALGSAIAAAPSAQAQVTGAEVTAVRVSEDKVEVADVIIVTGSRIKRDPTTSSLPLEIITNDTLDRNGIASPEALNMYLTSSASDSDNLASNSDVTTGAQRGTNGLSAANLRNQGSAATLVLLNGRRVAAHGLSGGAVDVNQIPFAAIDRIEVLKDGASAIYGTDAIGGVINYITKTNYQGIQVEGLYDITERGDSPIYRISATGGYGDLADQGFNIMGAISYGKRGALRGDQRDFVNTYQPERGLSVDTRGTPFATIMNTTNAGLQPYWNSQQTLTSGLTLTAPNGGNAAAGGINVLNLPGGAGCDSMDGGQPYDWELWNSRNNYYACAWDTGRAAVLQQPIETLTYYTKGTVALGASELSLEVTGSRAKSAKRFSNNQYAVSSSTPVYYPRNALTESTYLSLVNQLIAAFPSNAAELQDRADRGVPIAYRWRCIPCGDREYKTDSKTLRAYASIAGPLPWQGWDYNVGASYARSEVSSVLGKGYHYRGTYISGGPRGAPDPRAPTATGAQYPGIIGLLNAGILNPFSLSQTPAALAALEEVSAEGVTLYGGRYTVREFDGSISGPLFSLPGGQAQMAVGLDYRKEGYEFNGSDADAADMPNIFNAAFDNVNALTPKSRTVKAGYLEVDLPVHDMFNITGAVRVDDYSGFGTTTNPKVSARFEPTDWVMFRGSYSTGFRVPSFNQIFNGVTESDYSGSDIADPSTCPGGVATDAFGAGTPCAAIRPVILTGGSANLGPEKAKMASVGIVLRPTSNISLTADWWSIGVNGTIQTLTLRQLIDNYDLFPERFIRNGANEIVEIDRTWVNSGARRTQGIEFSGRGKFPVGGGDIGVGMDGSLLLKKKEKLTPDSDYSDSQIGIFQYSGDLGIKWKHNLWVNYSTDSYSVQLTQIYRSGYENNALPGIASGAITRPDYNERVKAYSIFNLSASYYGLAPGFKITGTVRNLFDKDPPFAITYDGNTGAGSSWEPRVADPRGRSYVISVSAGF